MYVYFIESYVVCIFYIYPLLPLSARDFTMQIIKQLKNQTRSLLIPDHHMHEELLKITQTKDHSVCCVFDIAISQ